jgi:hypothetical protein
MENNRQEGANQLMTKNEWKELYGEFDKILSDFLLAYLTCEGGSNKTNRGDAQRKVDSIIRTVKSRIDKNEEVYRLTWLFHKIVVINKKL